MATESNLGGPFLLRGEINLPLLSGKENIGRNITELREHGTRPRSEKQILAISLHKAYGDRKAPKVRPASSRRSTR